MKRPLITVALIISLSGCEWIGRQADNLGSHMPVIGERCEHWQCLTESGRQKSDMYKAMRDQQEPDATASGQPQPQQAMEPYQQPPAAYQPQPAPATAPYPQPDYTTYQ